MEFAITFYPDFHPPFKSRPLVVLQRDNWNDFSFRTLFAMHYYGHGHTEHMLIGYVKIMRLGQKPNEWTFGPETRVFGSIEELDGVFCSVGNNMEYYTNLVDLGKESALEILKALGDLSANQDKRKLFEEDECFNTSLMRETYAREAMDKAGALFELSTREELKFVMMALLPNANKPHSVDFDFSAHGDLPNRINLLVGVNGVGKTQLLARLAILLTRYSEDQDKEEAKNIDINSFLGKLYPIPSLYRGIAVSFNAFDNFDLPKNNTSDKFRYSYCGLRKGDGLLRSEFDIKNEIFSILENLPKDKRDIINSAVNDLICVFGEYDNEYLGSPDIYNSMSAGQKIVLNILCHIVGKIEEKTLILIDEPETHLHPMLVTTLINYLNEILKKYDSYAVISTHSPIVVQQVPSKYIKVIERFEGSSNTLPPLIECFGENLSEISRNVFHASESDRDYQHILDLLLEKNNNSISAVERIFDNKLGTNARLYLNSVGEN